MQKKVMTKKRSSDFWSGKVHPQRKSWLRLCIKMIIITSYGIDYDDIVGEFSFSHALLPALKIMMMTMMMMMNCNCKPEHMRFLQYVHIDHSVVIHITLFSQVVLDRTGRLMIYEVRKRRGLRMFEVARILYSSLQIATVLLLSCTSARKSLRYTSSLRSSSCRRTWVAETRDRRCDNGPYQ